MPNRLPGFVRIPFTLSGKVLLPISICLLIAGVILRLLQIGYSSVFIFAGLAGLVISIYLILFVPRE